jgi:Protein of unknown function (DUF3667)
MASFGTHTAPAHEPTAATTCPECATLLSGKFCHLCGARRVDHHEYTLRHFFSHLVHEVTHLDSKLFGTVRVLITKPGLLVADYLAGRRRRYVSPLRLFLVVFTLHLFLYTAFKTTALYDASFFVHADKTGAVNKLFDKLANKRHVSREVVDEQITERWHKGANFLQFGDVFAFALVVGVLFITRKRYFVEHLMFSLNINTFMLGLGILSWPYYYWRGGIGAQLPIFTLSFCLISTYLFFAARRVYGGSTGGLLVRTLFMFIGVEVARVFFIFLTFFIAFFSLLPR